MGEDIDRRVFTREDRVRYREKVHRCLDVFAQMLAEDRFDFDRPMTGMEIELNLVDADGSPAMLNSEVLRAIDDESFQTELARFNLEVNLLPRMLERDAVVDLEADLRGQLNRANARASELGAGMVMIGILPTLMPEHLTHESISEQPAVRPARRADADGARGGPAHRHRRRGGPGDLRRHDPARGGLHQRPVPPAGQPGRLRQPLERGPVPGRRPGRDGRQLAVLPRQGAVAGDPHRAVHPGHRHPPGRAEGARGPPARLVRRAVDHQRVRPVRGEQPVLPGAAADRGRRGPGRRAGGRADAAPAGAAAAQRNRVALEPPGVRRRRRPAAPAGREPGAAGRTHRGRHPGQRRAVLRRAPRDRAAWTGRCGARCRSPRPRRTS